jgi:hypothetical protein
MVLSKLQRLKVILLLSGYLYVVVTHLQYVEPRQATDISQSSAGTHIVPKGYDKSGHALLTIKKIYKSVINSNPDRENNKTAQHLYVTKLLFNHAPASAANLRLPPLRHPCLRFAGKALFLSPDLII